MAMDKSPSPMRLKSAGPISAPKIVPRPNSPTPKGKYTSSLINSEYSFILLATPKLSHSKRY